MDEIPRCASGKILKRKLREPYWAGSLLPGRLSGYVVAAAVRPSASICT